MDLLVVTTLSIDKEEIKDYREMYEFFWEMEQAKHECVKRHREEQERKLNQRKKSISFLTRAFLLIRKLLRRR